MKNILLLTDLTVQSLRPIHDIVKDNKGFPVIINVVHLISLPASISDLLFLNQSKPYQAVPENFTEALQLLRNKYTPSVERILFDFVYCNTSRYFNNFLEGGGINAVYMLSDYDYKQQLNQSEDITIYLKKCKVPLHKVSMNEESFSEHQNLSGLLNGPGKEKLLFRPKQQNQQLVTHK